MSSSQFTMIVRDKKVAKLGPKYPKINLTRLSHTTGYSLSHLSRIFGKKTNPSVKCLESIAVALGMELGDLNVAIKNRRLSIVKSS